MTMFKFKCLADHQISHSTDPDLSFYFPMCTVVFLLLLFLIINQNLRRGSFTLPNRVLEWYRVADWIKILFMHSGLC